jgi:hypothetical protein
MKFFEYCFYNIHKSVIFIFALSFVRTVYINLIQIN